MKGWHFQDRWHYNFHFIDEKMRLRLKDLSSVTHLVSVRIRYWSQFLTICLPFPLNCAAAYIELENNSVHSGFLSFAHVDLCLEWDQSREGKNNYFNDFPENYTFPPKSKHEYSEWQSLLIIGRTYMLRQWLHQKIALSLLLKETNTLES